jgi:hypothetical protein
VNHAADFLLWAAICLLLLAIAVYFSLPRIR